MAPWQLLVQSLGVVVLKCLHSLVNWKTGSETWVNKTTEITSK